MTREELQQFQQGFFNDCLATSRAKNNDYTGAGDDPFANFRIVEHNGISTTEAGMLVRMSDKMSRLATFAKKGVLEVKDESVTDTLKDLANYAALLAAYIEDKRNTPILTTTIPYRVPDELDKVIKAYNPLAPPHRY